VPAQDRLHRRGAYALPAAASGTNIRQKLNGASTAPRTGALKVTFLKRILGGSDERARLRPLYEAVVAAGRDPYWYREGGVPDTIDGRFDMIAAILALVLIRLEREGEAGRGETILLSETFIEDMDGSLRQIGIGDFVVGKHVGKMMGALGGRLAAFREGDFEAAVRRNVFREAPPSEEAVKLVAGRLRGMASALEGMDQAQLLAGALPTP
jgi:cytochrome b pre-mRNA-processing protein 3